MDSKQRNPNCPWIFDQSVQLNTENLKKQDNIFVELFRSTDQWANLKQSEHTKSYLYLFIYLLLEKHDSKWECVITVKYQQMTSRSKMKRFTSKQIDLVFLIKVCLDNRDFAQHSYYSSQLKACFFIYQRDLILT